MQEGRLTEKTQQYPSSVHAKRFNQGESHNINLQGLATILSLGKGNPSFHAESFSKDLKYFFCENLLQEYMEEKADLSLDCLH